MIGEGGRSMKLEGKNSASCSARDRELLLFLLLSLLVVLAMVIELVLLTGKDVEGCWADTGRTTAIRGDEEGEGGIGDLPVDSGEGGSNT